MGSNARGVHILDGAHWRAVWGTYRAKAAGHAALSAAKIKVGELFGELFEDEEGTAS